MSKKIFILLLLIIATSIQWIEKKPLNPVPERAFSEKTVAIKEKNSQFKKFAAGSVTQGGYLGAFIKGSQNKTESEITITGNVTVINDTSREIEVSIWKNNDQKAYVGTDNTTKDGFFNITFSYIKEDMVSCPNSLPIGNITINATAPVQSPNDGFLSPATKLYNASIYVRILNRLEMLSPVSHEIPSFEKQSEVTLLNRLEFNNGSLLKLTPLAGFLNFSNDTDDTSVDNKSITFEDGTNTSSFSNLSLTNGTYTIKSFFYLNRSPNNQTITNPWLIGEHTYLVNNTTAGAMLSTSNASLSVINASKIDLKFSSSLNREVKTLNKSREETFLKITGVHYNSTGEPSGSPMQLIIKKEEPRIHYRVYNSSSKNDWSSFNFSDTTGQFNWSIEINSSFTRGEYLIWGNDSISSNCVSAELRLTIKSKIEIVNITSPTNLIKTGKTFTISGKTIDAVNDSPISTNVAFSFNKDIPITSTLNLTHGQFRYTGNITRNITTWNVSVRFQAQRNFYWSTTENVSLRVYNYVNASIKLENRTYLWVNGKNTVFYGVNRTFTTSKSVVNLSINVKDGYNGQSLSGNITIFFLNKTTILDPNNNTTVLNITESGILEIDFPYVKTNVSITINKESDRDNGGNDEDNEVEEIPSSVLIVSTILISLGGLGVVGKFIIGGKTVKPKRRSLDWILKQLKSKIEEDERKDAVRLAGEAIFQLGKQFGVTWKPEWTPREFFLKLTKSKKTYSYEKNLRKIYPIYEEVVFAELNNWKPRLKKIRKEIEAIYQKLKNKEESKNA